ncbi:MAG: hypothetical protein IT314_08800 [Anaerolineales bacterium]|nr:hypothetical protein [Anaerolineales bacterium]
MGKYTSMVKKQETPRVTGVNPVMKGLGCFIMLIVPPISYAFAALLVPIVVAQGMPLPPEWLGNVKIPALLWQLEGLAPVFRLIQSQDRLIANLVFALGIMVVIGGIMAIFFGYLYKFFGPSPYGPTDVPPIRVKVKRYKR